ncbi:Fc.00g052240.m01.CDS01 [Cosmosporella sp. VM-42]
MASSDDEMNDLIRDVVEASKLSAKSRTLNIKPTVANLVSLCYDRGLQPDALADLVDLVTKPSHLDQASLAAITRNLYPTSHVSRDVILRVISSLGHGKIKPSLTLQAALLKWLIMVYHALEAPQTLSQAYPVLFNLLDTAAIRPHLSHLLALITRRKHVRPFRIQTLLNLSRQTGNDPCLIGLLRVFKDYYPEIIVGEAVRGKASAFKHPDPSWRETLDEIQEAHRQQTQELVSGPRDGFRTHRLVNRGLRNKLVPVVHTSHATEDSVTLEEIENASSFVQNIDKLELPNQLVAVLADPLLQKLLLLRPSDESQQRIANWLSSILQDVIDGETDQMTLFNVLDVLRDFVVSTKSLPPLLLNFFARFLQLWDGIPGRITIFQILPYAPLIGFDELYQHIFQPLETASVDDTPESQLALLSLYTNLLRHWTVILQASSPIPEHASTSISLLIRHVNTLALTVAQTSPTVTTHSAILEFYEQSVRLVTNDTLKHYIRIELPPSWLVYILLFSNSLAVVSRLCNILACYKKGFETAMSTKTRKDGSNQIDSNSYNRAYVNLYNGFLMDICNCFWRARAFSDSDTNAHGCMLPRSIIPALASYVTSVEKAFALTSLFGLSHSPILCLQSIQRVRELEDAEMEKDNSIRTRHAGPVTQTSLPKLGTSGGIGLTWQEYRITVLEALSAKELAGVAELLKNTMTVLKNSMEGRSKRSQKSTQ